MLNNISNNRFSLVTCLAGLLIITNISFILQCLVVVFAIFCLFTYFICLFLIGLVEVIPLVLFWTVLTFDILCILYVVKRLVDFIELKYNSQDGRAFTFTDFISRDFSFLRNRVQSPVDNDPRQSDDHTRNNVNENLDSLYPCLNPINRYLQNYETRLSTFLTWGGAIVRTQPEEIAEAGFFYTGESDRVKCWYCDGLLYNWGSKKTFPWFEHAKFYPQCEYLLQKKGPQYVCEITAQFPDLNRSVPRNSSYRCTPLDNVTECDKIEDDKR